MWEDEDEDEDEDETEPCIERAPVCSASSRGKSVSNHLRGHTRPNCPDCSPDSWAHPGKSRIHAKYEVDSRQDLSQQNLETSSDCGSEPGRTLQARVQKPLCGSGSRVMKTRLVVLTGPELLDRTRFHCEPPGVEK
ncbi:unnamed protein product [Pleuronectes platessa]|uniref:Uncharacterized protein n=1 Tax=Pleuronectes platessa TaxID=8262 RepID=A0A9N7UR83_PLEPL|nr:unnamed protein product [Pleuronectes platessa]